MTQVVKRGQKTNADKRISELEAQVAAAEKALAAKLGLGQPAFAGVQLAA